MALSLVVVIIQKILDESGIREKFDSLATVVWISKVVTV